MSADDSVIIRTRDLTRRFGDLTAVDHITIDILQGEIFGLVGPDGAGKTTALRLFCGLLDPTEGYVEVAGYNVSKDIESVKDQIGYMAQRFGLYGDLTVEENILFYADLFGIPRKERSDLMVSLLKMTRMQPFMKRQARKLSGGMKQKLALMCTLLHRPRILFLDEPTNGVDPVSRRDFWSILYQLVKDGITVFVTTAYMDEAERCTRVGMMHRGCLIRYDSPDVIKNSLQEVCYELQCQNQRAAREVLNKCDGVLSVEPYGSVLHLFLSPMRISTETLKKTLDESGIKQVIFRSIAPSLEDVFIALIQKASYNNGG